MDESYRLVVNSIISHRKGVSSVLIYAKSRPDIKGRLLAYYLVYWLPDGQPRFPLAIARQQEHDRIGQVGYPISQKTTQAEFRPRKDSCAAQKEYGGKYRLQVDGEPSGI